LRCSPHLHLIFTRPHFLYSSRLFPCRVLSSRITPFCRSAFLRFSCGCPPSWQTPRYFFQSEEFFSVVIWARCVRVSPDRSPLPSYTQEGVPYTFWPERPPCMLNFRVKWFRTGRKKRRPLGGSAASFSSGFFSLRSQPCPFFLLSEFFPFLFTVFFFFSQFSPAPLPLEDQGDACERLFDQRPFPQTHFPPDAGRPSKGSLPPTLNTIRAAEPVFGPFATGRCLDIALFAIPPSPCARPCSFGRQERP